MTYIDWLAGEIDKAFRGLCLLPQREKSSQPHIFKGGQNPPNESIYRPEPPKGSNPKDCR